MRPRNAMVCAVIALRGLMLLGGLLGGPMAEAAQASGFAAAEKAFEGRLSAEQRVRLQVMMIATGYWLAMPNADFGQRFFEAIRRFQSEGGYPATGILDDEQTARLTSAAEENFSLWGFRTVVHPFRRLKIWVPFGLDLAVERNKFGLHFTDPQRRVLIDFTTVPGIEIGTDYGYLLTSMIREQQTINYKVIKDGWFVISATGADGIDHYMRYHQDGSNVTGFSLSWNNANGNVHGERIATLMSASLWADTVGPFDIDPPALLPRPAAAAADPAPAPQPAPPAQVAVAAPPTPPSPPPADAAKPVELKTGTAFFLSKDGTLLTNAHVVDGCAAIRVKTQDGAVTEASVAAIDATNDLAVLRTSLRPTTTAAFRIGARLGEAVEAFGFPHSDMLSTSGNFTMGNITALNGMGDDSRYMQFSAPVQAGNSGGPLFDKSGNVVGIVTLKLNALKVALEGGDLPQNVNFAVKTGIIAAFLDSNRVLMQTAAPDAKPMDPPDIADQARAASAFVMCKEGA